MKPLFIPLKTRWFREFWARTKDVEYRVYGARWHEGTCVIGRKVTISHGYSGERMHGTVAGFARIPLSRAPHAARQFFAGATHLAAIKIAITE